MNPGKYSMYYLGKLKTSIERLVYRCPSFAYNSQKLEKKKKKLKSPKIIDKECFMFPWIRKASLGQCCPPGEAQ